MTRENARGGVVPTTSVKPYLEANLFAFVKIGDGVAGNYRIPTPELGQFLT